MNVLYLIYLQCHHTDSSKDIALAVAPLFLLPVHVQLREETTLFLLLIAKLLEKFLAVGYLEAIVAGFLVEKMFHRV